MAPLRYATAYYTAGCLSIGRDKLHPQHATAHTPNVRANIGRQTIQGFYKVIGGLSYS